MLIPKSSKHDISYVGRHQASELELSNRLQQVQLELKQNRVGVAIAIVNGKLALRYQLGNGDRKRISPNGMGYNHQGLDRARQYAIRIGEAMANGTYTDEWLQTSIYKRYKKTVATPSLLWQTVLDTWENKYLQSRKGANTTERQRLNTLTGYRSQLKLGGTIKPSTIFNAALISSMLGQQDEGTDKRGRLREVLSVICKLYEVNYDFSGIGKRPKPTRRELPTDNEIVEMWKSFSDIDTELGYYYQWCFGLQATYGLRTQEVFAVNWDKSFKPATANWLYIDESLTDGLKTGSRWCMPLHVGWVDKFNLACKPVGGASTDTHRYRSLGMSSYLARHGIGCKPYDLRHCFAVRARKLNIPTVDVAACMGHDVATHVKQYQRWISLEDRISSVARALA